MGVQDDAFSVYPVIILIMDAHAVDVLRCQCCLAKAVIAGRLAKQAAIADTVTPPHFAVQPRHAGNAFKAGAIGIELLQAIEPHSRCPCCGQRAGWSAGGTTALAASRSIALTAPTAAPVSTGTVCADQTERQIQRGRRRRLGNFHQHNGRYWHKWPRCWCLRGKR